ncbi:hypothetical protein BU23DRAFT_200677 [Bimuria novae-zelandiae CBS 107.79]|uniref:Uncharacterized protein n=1 Tax=Bimuria novae-zelandiae CBS 107.79 TaxID=1447943 RepID=A0A6A5V0C8_9PLEO|nr:hypothetical protein BU23DRAFT_200677 [Bimuria novae-zelandiae CBS 107.79]
MTSTLDSGTAWEQIPANPLVPSSRKSRILAHIRDCRPATSSITRDGDRSALHTAITSERQGSDPCNISWALNSFTEMQASWKQLAQNAVAAKSVPQEPDEADSARLQPAVRPSRTVVACTRLACTRQTVAWVRITACMTAGCVPASQIQLPLTEFRMMRLLWIQRAALLLSCLELGRSILLAFTGAK